MASHLFKKRPSSSRDWNRARTQTARERRFRAAVDDKTSITIYEKQNETYWIIKKDLVDYEVQVRASEAPVSNLYLKTPDPFETVVIDISLLEKDIFPICDAVRSVFGKDRELELTSVRLAVGSKMSDFISIDETDLLSSSVEPTLLGLEEFVETNRDGLVGLIDRFYEQDKGNIIFMEASLKNPCPSIKSIEVRVLTSLQQRGLFMQQNHEYFGLERYVIVRSRETDDTLLDFLKQIGVDWELIYLRRELSVGNWTEIECERNSANLKGYLRANFPLIGYIDINNILRVVVRNQLNFKIAVKTAEFLSKLKAESSSREDYNARPLSKAEIAAAARLASAYYGVRNIQVDSDINPAEIQRFEDELVKL